MNLKNYYQVFSISKERDLSQSVFLYYIQIVYITQMYIIINL
jgi:hypothetical protein